MKRKEYEYLLKRGREGSEEEEEEERRIMYDAFLCWVVGSWFGFPFLSL